MFLAAFHRSLYSGPPTTPLAIGSGVGHGSDILDIPHEPSNDPGFGGVSHPMAAYTYGLTSWRPRAARVGLIHSIGCAGFLPGLWPAADGMDGWWVMLAREGGTAVGCIGTGETMAAWQSGLEEKVVSAVRAHRSGSGAGADERARYVAANRGATCAGRDPRVSAACACGENMPVLPGARHEACAGDDPTWFAVCALMPPGTCESVAQDGGKLFASVLLNLCTAECPGPVTGTMVKESGIEAPVSHQPMAVITNETQQSAVGRAAGPIGVGLLAAGAVLLGV